MRRAEQSIDVLAQTEDRRAPVALLVAADALEHPEAVVQRVREDVHLRLVPGHQLAVQPDAIGLLHHGQS